MRTFCFPNGKTRFVIIGLMKNQVNQNNHNQDEAIERAADFFAELFLDQLNLENKKYEEQGKKRNPIQ